MNPRAVATRRKRVEHGNESVGLGYPVPGQPPKDYWNEANR